MITTEMFASGCKGKNPAEEAKSQNQENTEIEETKAETPKPGVNDDGIYIYAPKAALDFNSSYTYGEIIHKSYYSKTAEKEKNVAVMLPPNYTPEKKYPVLYLLHGIFGDENSMIGSKTSGCAVTISNMMNSGEASEMIVVFPFMYTSKTQPQCTAIDEPNIEAYDIFVEDLAESLMPWMKENFSILEGRENTAITGFSMGGREALAIGLQRPDLFGYIGSIAPAPGLTPGKDFAAVHKGQFTEDGLKFKDGDPLPKFILLCAGDRDSVVGSFPVSYHNIFTKNEVDHIWWFVPGSDHGDPAISSGIYNFCKRIFK